jgi:hypothetical protein
MAMLGEALVFHLQYMAEMNRHFGDKAHITLPTETQEMVRQVGAAAYEQAADFLSLCDARIERHFCGLGATLVTRRSRSGIRDSWCCDAKIAFDKGEFSCGTLLTSIPEITTTLPEGACGALVPWLWLKGGRKSEEQAWNALGGKAHSRSGEGLVKSRGGIALSLIPVMRDMVSFNVEREPLLDQLSASLRIVGRRELRLLASHAVSES